MKVVFLDIDGVLNHQHFGSDEQSMFGFDDKCIDGLRYILCCTGAKIVITSAWRNFDYEPRVSSTMPWRRALEEKLCKPGAIIGQTPHLDGRAKADGTRMTRADEIIEWMHMPHMHEEKIDSYAILDDEVSCYKGTELEDNVVDCDIKNGTGLDAVNACHAVRILKGTIGPKANGDADEMVPSICYQGLLDDARNMADTLRKIDRELADAAQCEGDCPGGYPPSKLLPQLCKIMYSCLGNYRNERYD